MGVVLRGSLMRLKMSWYEWGFMAWYIVLLRCKCMHVLE